MTNRMFESLKNSFYIYNLSFRKMCCDILKVAPGQEP